MDRKVLESRAANYPYLQGLWPMATGMLWILIGLSNLDQAPSGVALQVVAVGMLLLVVAGEQLISKHYRENYGEVIPTRTRRRRYTIASIAWTAVGLIGLIVPVERVCLLVTTFAAATLVFYAVLTGVRGHHWAVWTPVLVAGLLPIWDGLGEQRNVIVMIPLGALLILTGLLDQRALRHDFAAVAIPAGESSRDASGIRQ